MKVFAAHSDRSSFGKHPQEQCLKQRLHPSTWLLACRWYHMVEIRRAPSLGVIRRKEITLKCKLSSVAISMDSPLPFNSTESIMLCLISAAIATEKRCTSHCIEHSAFEKSSWCSFQVEGEEICFTTSFYSRAGTHTWPEVVENVIN